MKGGEHMSMPNVIFRYDGSFEGFLCCVFDSYVYKIGRAHV